MVERDLYWTFQHLNNKEANQTVRARRLLYAFVFRVKQSQVFFERNPKLCTTLSGPGLLSKTSCKAAKANPDLGDGMWVALSARGPCHIKYNGRI